jgi:hypothetical protein
MTKSRDLRKRRQKRELHDAAVENQRLRQLLAGLCMESDPKPLIIHMSSLHAMKDGHLNIQHNVESGCVEIRLRGKAVQEELDAQERSNQDG